MDFDPSILLSIGKGFLEFLPGATQLLVAVTQIFSNSQISAPKVEMTNIQNPTVPAPVVPQVQNIAQPETHKNLQSIMKELSQQPGKFSDWRDEKQNHKVKEALQEWQSGNQPDLMLKNIQDFLAKQKPGDYTVNAVLAEVRSLAIELTTDPNLKAQRAFEYAEFTKNYQTTPIREFDTIHSNYANALYLANDANAQNYASNDQKKSDAMRAIINQSHGEMEKVRDYMEKVTEKIVSSRSFVPTTDELDIYRNALNKVIKYTNDSAENKKNCDIGFDMIYRLNMGNDSATQFAQLAVADKILDSLNNTSESEVTHKVQTFLQLAHDFEVSGRTNLIDNSAKFYQEVLREAKIDELHAPAALAAGRLFVASKDPAEKQALAAQVAESMMASKKGDFDKLFKEFNSFDSASHGTDPIKLLQDKELRHAVAVYIKDNVKPEEIKDMINHNNMVVEWLQTPTSLLGLSKFTGGTDAFQILEKATQPKVEVPLEIKAFPAAPTPPQAKAEPATLAAAPPPPPAPPIVAPQRTAQKSFHDAKVIEAIKKELPQWSMKDDGPGPKEMTNGTEKFEIQKSGLTTNSADANTYEAMLQTMKTAHKDLNPKPNFEITLNKDDPKVKADWEKAITKIYGDEGKHIKVKVELPALTAAPAGPKPPEQEHRQSFSK